MNEIATSGVKKEAGLCLLGQLPNGVFKGGALIYAVGMSGQLKRTSAAFTRRLRSFNKFKEKRDYID